MRVTSGRGGGAADLNDDAPARLRSSLAVDGVVTRGEYCAVEPETRYATSGDVSVAYQVVGEGPEHLVLAPGFLSHLELAWEEPSLRRFLLRLASFRRLVIFDKRGTGLSDPTLRAPTLEERTDDLRAVMDAAGVERAAILGFSEGGTMAMMFAAQHPERTSALVLYGTWARLLRAPDNPDGVEPEELERFGRLVERWGSGAGLGAWAPSRRDDPRLRDWWARLQRQGASPSVARTLFSSYADLDARCLLGSIHVPSLVLHRRGDRMVPIGLGRQIAERIPDARFVELEGEDHLYFVGDTEALLDEIEDHLTGTRRGPRPQRVVTSVLFGDLVGSTVAAAEQGDRRWTEQLAAFQDVVRRHTERSGGWLVGFSGDGYLATFDGPARGIGAAVAIREGLARVGLEVRQGLHTGEIELLDDDVAGIAVHLAARIMGLADAGEVLVSSTVRDLVVGSDLGFEPRGLHELKGIPGSWQVLSVTEPAVVA
jgi:pimeloyl-ACP methyl ester carboxylesterase